MKGNYLLVYLAIIHNGDWQLIYRSIRGKDIYEISEEAIMSKVDSLKCKWITILDKAYPHYLKQIPFPPIVLFYQGDISLIYDYNSNLAVIGSRDPSSWGVDVTKKLVGGLKKEIVIVSGLAKGVDGIAHQTAIDNHHKTIAVLGGGFDRFYPSENKGLYDNIIANPHNLVISEYPPSHTPTQSQFPMRNRLISAFSKAILVTEAKIKSGTTITIGHALSQNRDVLCVPSSDLGESGCNMCIKDGGFLVETVEDIEAFFGFGKLL